MPVSGFSSLKPQCREPLSRLDAVSDRLNLIIEAEAPFISIPHVLAWV